MTTIALFERLNAFERQNPVNDWVIDGVQVWPLIKINVFFKFWYGKNDNGKSSKKAKRHKSKINKAVKAIFSLFDVLRLFLKVSSKTPTIIFSDSNHFWSRYKDRFINRYFQPMIEYMDKNGANVNYLFINEDEQTGAHPKGVPIIFIRKYFPGAKIIYLLRKKKTTEYLPSFESFLTSFSDEELKLDVLHYKKGIKDLVSYIKAYQIMTDIIVKKYKVITIFELCYYATIRYALNLSSREMNIPVFEIQHGGMGPGHVSYSGWNNLPARGYNVLPQTFWLWDQASKELLEPWIAKQKFHKCILGGNPWIDYVTSSSDNKDYIFPEKDKMILYTLQYNKIESYILEAIKETPESFKWWIRLHPRKLYMKNQIFKTMKDWGIEEKVEVEKATAFPLPVLLKQAAIHLSESSGSIIEAAQLGVPSLILSEGGVVYYKGYVNQGIAIPETSHSAKAVIEKIKKYSHQKNDFSCLFKLNAEYKNILDHIIEKI